MTDPLRLAAVVVTYNRRRHIELTLARLLAEPVDHVIVVDNGSTDGTRAWLAGLDDPRLCLLLPDENLGGAGGFELGLRQAVARFDPDWMVVMDDDARPAPGCFATFRAKDRSGWDGLAAAVFFPAGGICEMNRPSLNPFWRMRAFLRAVAKGGRRGFHVPDSAYHGDQILPVDGASFVGLFLSRRAIAEAGYPDGRLFIYGDDTLYTLGCVKRGLRIGMAATLRFEHDFTTLDAGHRVFQPLWKSYYHHRNLLFVYRFAAGPFFWPALLIVLPKWALKARHYRGADRAEYWRLLRQAVADALRQRLDRPVPGPAD